MNVPSSSIDSWKVRWTEFLMTSTTVSGTSWNEHHQVSRSLATSYLRFVLSVYWWVLLRDNCTDLQSTRISALFHYIEVLHYCLVTLGLGINSNWICCRSCAEELGDEGTLLVWQQDLRVKVKLEVRLERTEMNVMRWTCRFTLKWKEDKCTAH